MDVNTICLEKADYDALVREQYALGKQVEDLDAEVKHLNATLAMVRNLVADEAEKHIKNRDRFFRYCTISTEDVAESIGMDFPSLCSYVETAIRTDMEGYQE